MAEGYEERNGIGMPRHLRIQYPGALYHVINRGNFRQAVFGSRGAALAFERTLVEAVQRFRWALHAYVILSNHFHLALQTPEPNLSEGMHWLLTTFCIRHNRFRRRHGHLFQGRYKALLIENESYLGRVIDYIHLNPVRAALVHAARLADYRWNSLWWQCRSHPPEWLCHPPDSAPLEEPDGLSRLIDLAEDGGDDDRLRTAAFSRGWAIGTNGWRRALAKEHSAARLSAGLLREELRDLRETLWHRELEGGLLDAGKSLRDAEREPKSAAWKIALARRLRSAANAPHRWIAETLHMGASSSVRVYLSATSN